MTSSSPDHLKYTASHEWVREEAPGTIVMGISDHAQSLLGDVVFVELPDVGKTVSAGEGFAVVESVKAAADVYAPMAGEVIAVNEALTSAPELMNADPYEGGWLCKLKVTDSAEMSKLMSAEDYDKGN
jgi:glycine cleavage system H protein